MKRFWNKVLKTDSCWLWQARRDDDGYGQTFYQGHMAKAHGPIIPSSLYVLHRCDNPPCVNPAHLFLGTARINALDRDSKGRANTPSGSRHRSATQPDATPRGEAHGRAKVTRRQVNAIRQMRVANKATYAQIGKHFGLSITQVINRQQWAI